MKPRSKDLYAVLGLARGASEGEIKSAYRKLARKYHPDMHAGKAEAEQKRMQDRFAELAEAYEVLTNPQKKKIYDACGQVFEEGEEPAAAPGGFSFAGGVPGGFAEMFEGMRGGFGAGHGGLGAERIFFGDERPRAAPRAPNELVQHTLAVSLEEMFAGAQKRLKIRKRLRSGEAREHFVHVDVKPGYKKGTKITFPGAGDELPDGRGTDIQVVLDERPHARFQRVDANLVCELAVGFKEALGGFARTLTSIDGHTKIALTDRDVQEVGEDHTVRGEGMPDRTRGGRRGDLVVRTRVRLDLTPREREAVKRALAGAPAA